MLWAEEVASEGLFRDGLVGCYRDLCECSPGRDQARVRVGTGRAQPGWGLCGLGVCGSLSCSQLGHREVGSTLSSPVCPAQAGALSGLGMASSQLQPSNYTLPVSPLALWVPSLPWCRVAGVPGI